MATTTFYLVCFVRVEPQGSISYVAYKARKFYTHYLIKQQLNCNDGYKLFVLSAPTRKNTDLRNVTIDASSVGTDLLI